MSKLSASLSLTRKGNRTMTPTTPPTSTASNDNASDQLNHQNLNCRVDNDNEVEYRSATLTTVAALSPSHSNRSKQSIIPSAQRRPTSTTAGKKRSRNSNGHTVTIATNIDTMKSNKSNDENFNKLTNKVDGHKTPMLLFSNDNNTNNSSNPQLSSLSPTVASNTYNSSSLSPSSPLSPSNKRQKRSGAPIGQSRSLLLDSIPHDVLSNILSFLILPVDYYAIQLTCKEFHTLSDQDDFLKYVDININSGCGGGDNENNDATTATNTSTTDNDQNQTTSSSSGKGSIVYNVQSPVVAVERLYKFANAGNLQALYM